MLPGLGELGKLFTSNHLASADSPFSLSTIFFHIKQKLPFFTKKNEYLYYNSITKKNTPFRNLTILQSENS